MKDKDFDNLFKHKLSHLSEPKPDMGQWESLNSNLHQVKTNVRWQRFKWAAAASVLIAGNVFFFYKWQTANVALSQSKEINTSFQQTNNATNKSVAELAVKNLTGTPSSKQSSKSISPNGKKNTILNTNTISLEGSHKITHETSFPSTKINNIEKAKTVSFNKSTEASNILAKTDISIFNKENYANSKKEILANQAEQLTNFTENKLTSEPVETSIDKLANNIITEINLGDVSGISNLDTIAQKTQSISSITSNAEKTLVIAEQKTDTAEGAIVATPFIKPVHKSLFALPDLHLGTWIGKLHLFPPKGDASTGTNYGFFADAGIYKGLRLGIIFSADNFIIQSDKPDFFKNHPPHHPDPDFKFASLMSENINIIQYGFSLKYEFKNIHRWQPYIALTPVIAKIDSVNVRFEFKNHEHKDEDSKFIDEKIKDGSNSFQGVNLSAGIAYRISSRWSAFADGNYFKNFNNNIPPIFDNIGIKAGIFYQL